MTLRDFTKTNKGRLDAALPPDISDRLRMALIGTHLRAMKTFLFRKGIAATTVNPYVNAAALPVISNPTAPAGDGGLMGLPDDAKACTILRAVAMAGTGTKGELVVDGLSQTPAAGHIAISANGDIVTNSTDAFTSIDVVYEPWKLDIVEQVLPCVAGTGVCALPMGVIGGGVLLLLEAEGLVGTTVEKKIVLAPAAGAPATHNARLDLAKVNVQFAVADALTSVRVKLGIVPASDLDAYLEADTQLL